MRDPSPEALLAELLASGVVREQDISQAKDALQRRGAPTDPASVLSYLIQTQKVPATSCSSLTAEDLPTQAVEKTEKKAPALPEALASRFQDFSFLGQGGMGVVYRAYDPVLQRPVAVKLLRGTGQQASALLREARHQARVEHPHICPVFEVGEAEGIPYVVMHYVEGANLLTLQEKLPRKQLLALLARIARTVHAAHQRGLVHGDLKPANILLENTPEGLHPWLVDFGVATALSETGPVQGGTPAYMAPELVRGEPPSPAGDIFSLGATLYHLLAGEPPGKGSSLEVLQERLSPEWSPPPLPEGVADPELAAIVGKAMAADPGERYASALALAEDLERYITNRPVQAMPATWAYRARKWYLRHTVQAWIGLGVGLALLGSLASAGWVWQRSRREAALRADLMARVVGVEERLRRLWTAPPHNVRPELSALEEELRAAALKARQKGLSEGAMHYLLGKAFLALGKAKEAEEELARAWNPKRPVPEIAEAFAEALVRRYLEEAPQLARLPRAEWREKRARELEEQYLKRAQALLGTQNGPAQSESFVEALLAAARKDWVQAANAAEKSFAAKPWQFEALLLKGDAFMELARSARQGGRWSEAAEHLGHARQAFETLVSHAPSHPRGFLGLARVALEQGVLAKEQGLDPENRWRESLAQAEQALKLDSQLVDAHVHAAYTLLRWTDHLVRRGEVVPKTLSGAIGNHVAALAAFPEQAAEAETYLGISLLLSSWQAGEDEALALRQQAREHLREALALNPRLLLAINNLGLLTLQEGIDALNQGRDPTSSLLLAREQFRRLSQEFPKSEAAPANLAATVWAVGHWELWQGHDPRPTLAEGRKALQTRLATNPRDAVAKNNLASLLLLEATWLQWRGQAAEPVLREAWELLAEPELAEADPNVVVTRLQVAVARLREALLGGQKFEEIRAEFLPLLGSVKTGGDAFDAAAAAAEALLLLAAVEPARGQRYLLRGLEYLRNVDQRFELQADVCRLQIAYAVATGQLGQDKLPRAGAAKSCLDHWQSSAVFQRLARLSSGEKAKGEEDQWPGLGKEVTLWQKLGTRKALPR